MRGSWWKWLSAVLAIVFGLIFGWVAGTGLVQAAGSAVVSAPEAADPHALHPCDGETVRRDPRTID